MPREDRAFARSVSTQRNGGAEGERHWKPKNPGNPRLSPSATGPRVAAMCNTVNRVSRCFFQLGSSLSRDIQRRYRLQITLAMLLNFATANAPSSIRLLPPRQSSATSIPTVASQAGGNRWYLLRPHVLPDIPAGLALCARSMRLCPCQRSRLNGPCLLSCVGRSSVPTASSP